MRPSINTGIAINAARKAISNINRDFQEIQYLQSSKFGANRFAQKAYDRIHNSLSYELQKARADFDIVSDGKFFQEYSWVILPIDGFKNFERGLDNFCISIALVEKVDGGKAEAICCVAQMLTNQQTFWVEKGKGAFKEDLNGRNFKLKVSGNTNIEEAVICLNEFDEESVKRFNKSNVRITGSDVLSTIGVASGNYDCFVSDKKNFNTKYFALFATEAGGKLNTDGEKITISNGKIA